MATIVKRDGSEIPIKAAEVDNVSLKKDALRIIADHAIITEWEEIGMQDGHITLKMECIIDRKKLR
jgi:hypothetical protein